MTLRSFSDTPGDLSVFHRADDGRELRVGRIFRNSAIKDVPWIWTVEFHQPKCREEPLFPPCQPNL